MLAFQMRTNLTNPMATQKRALLHWATRIAWCSALLPTTTDFNSFIMVEARCDAC
jgi:hypothetical protein